MVGEGHHKEKEGKREGGGGECGCAPAACYPRTRRAAMVASPSSARPSRGRQAVGEESRPLTPSSAAGKDGESDGGVSWATPAGVSSTDAPVGCCCCCCCCCFLRLDLFLRCLRLLLPLLVVVLVVVALPDEAAVADDPFALCCCFCFCLRDPPPLPGWWMALHSTCKVTWVNQGCVVVLHACLRCGQFETAQTWQVVVASGEASSEHTPCRERRVS